MILKQYVENGVYIMQENTISLTITDASDDVTEVTDIFEKRILEPYKSEFREETTQYEPNLAFNRFTLRGKEAIPSSGSFGVMRSYINLRKDYTVPTPDGSTRLSPATFKPELSIPVGMDPVDKENFIRWCRALINSTEFIDLVTKLST